MALKRVDRGGIKQALDWINALRQIKSCVTAGTALLPANCHAHWFDNHYSLDFATTNHVELNKAYYGGMQSFVISISGNDYEVPARGASIAKWNKNFINPDVVEMQVSQFRTPGLDDD